MEVDSQCFAGEDSELVLGAYDSQDYYFSLNDVSLSRNHG
jgi:hypothetical protein